VVTHGAAVASLLEQAMSHVEDLRLGMAEGARSAGAAVAR
jgi:hypothetical protein